MDILLDLSPGELYALRKAFIAGGGELSESAWVSAYASLRPSEPPWAETQGLLTDGQSGEPPWVGGDASQRVAAVAALQALFRLVDANSDANLSFAELTSAVIELGMAARPPVRARAFSFTEDGAALNMAHGLRMRSLRFVPQLRCLLVVEDGHCAVTAFSAPTISATASTASPRVPPLTTLAKLLTGVSGSSDVVLCVEYIEEFCLIVLSISDLTLQLWDARPLGGKRIPGVAMLPVAAGAPTPTTATATTAASATAPGGGAFTLSINDATPRTPIFLTAIHTPTPQRQLGWLNVAGKLLTAGLTPELHIWSLASQCPSRYTRRVQMMHRGSLLGHTGVITCIVPLTHLGAIATTSVDGTLRIWGAFGCGDGEGGSRGCTGITAAAREDVKEGGGGGLRCAASATIYGAGGVASPTATTISVGGIYALAVLEGVHGGGIRCGAYLSSSRQIVTAGYGHSSIQVWDVREVIALATAVEMSAAATAAPFSSKSCSYVLGGGVGSDALPAVLDIVSLEARDTPFDFPANGVSLKGADSVRHGIDGGKSGSRSVDAARAMAAMKRRHLHHGQIVTIDAAGVLRWWDVSRDAALGIETRRLQVFSSDATSSSTATTIVDVRGLACVCFAPEPCGGNGEEELQLQQMGSKSGGIRDALAAAMRSAEANNAVAGAALLTIGPHPKLFVCARVEEDHPVPSAVAYVDTSLTIVTATQRDLRVFNAQTGALERIFCGVLSSAASPGCLALDGERRRLVIGCVNGSAIVISNASGVSMKVLPQHAAGVTGVAFVAQDGLIVSAGRDGRLHVCDDTNEVEGGGSSDLGECVLLRRVKHAHGRGVAITALSVDHALSLIATAGGGIGGVSVRVWDLCSCEPVGSVEGGVGHDADITALAWVSPYPVLASGDAAGVVLLWHVCRTSRSTRCIVRVACGAAAPSLSKGCDVDFDDAAARVHAVWGSYDASCSPPPLFTALSMLKSATKHASAARMEPDDATAGALGVAAMCIIPSSEQLADSILGPLSSLPLGRQDPGVAQATATALRGTGSADGWPTLTVADTHGCISFFDLSKVLGELHAVITAPSTPAVGGGAQAPTVPCVTLRVLATPDPVGVTTSRDRSRRHSVSTQEVAVPVSIIRLRPAFESIPLHRQPPNLPTYKPRLAAFTSGDADDVAAAVAVAAATAAVAAARGHFSASSLGVHSAPPVRAPVLRARLSAAMSIATASAASAVATSQSSQVPLLACVLGAQWRPFVVVRAHGLHQQVQGDTASGTKQVWRGFTIHGMSFVHCVEFVGLITTGMDGTVRAFSLRGDALGVFAVATGSQQTPQVALLRMPTETVTPTPALWDLRLNMDNRVHVIKAAATALDGELFAVGHVSSATGGTSDEGVGSALISAREVIALRTAAEASLVYTHFAAREGHGAGIGLARSRMLGQLLGAKTWVPELSQHDVAVAVGEGERYKRLEAGRMARKTAVTNATAAYRRVGLGLTRSEQAAAITSLQAEVNPLMLDASVRELTHLCEWERGEALLAEAEEAAVMDERTGIRRGATDAVTLKKMGVAGSFDIADRGGRARGGAAAGCSDSDEELPINMSVVSTSTTTKASVNSRFLEVVRAVARRAATRPDRLCTTVSGVRVLNVVKSNSLISQLERDRHKLPALYGEMVRTLPKGLVLPTTTSSADVGASMQQQVQSFQAPQRISGIGGRGGWSASVATSWAVPTRTADGTVPSTSPTTKTTTPLSAALPPRSSTTTSPVTTPSLPRVRKSSIDQQPPQQPLLARRVDGTTKAAASSPFSIAATHSLQRVQQAQGTPLQPGAYVRVLAHAYDPPVSHTTASSGGGMLKKSSKGQMVRSASMGVLSGSGRDIARAALGSTLFVSASLEQLRATAEAACVADAAQASAAAGMGASLSAATPLTTTLSASPLMDGHSNIVQLSAHQYAALDRRNNVGGVTKSDIAAFAAIAAAATPSMIAIGGDATVSFDAFIAATARSSGSHMCSVLTARFHAADLEGARNLSLWVLAETAFPSSALAQRAEVLAFIAYQLQGAPALEVEEEGVLSPEAIEQVKELFALYDTDGSGTISCLEMEEALMIVAGLTDEQRAVANAAPAASAVLMEIRGIVLALPRTADGEVGFEAFLALMAPAFAGV